MVYQRVKKPANANAANFPADAPYRCFELTGGARDKR
jgi:hypothetical protein